MKKISYAGYRFPPDFIDHTIWLYLQFTLSFRDVEDLLAERGIVVSYETVRRWVNHFGPWALGPGAARADFLVELRGFEPLTSARQAPARRTAAPPPGLHRNTGQSSAHRWILIDGPRIDIRSRATCSGSLRFVVPGPT
jgi:hypothetical protein